MQNFYMSIFVVGTPFLACNYINNMSNLLKFDFRYGVSGMILGCAHSKIKFPQMNHTVFLSWVKPSLMEQ